MLVHDTAFKLELQVDVIKTKSNEFSGKGYTMWAEKKYGVWIIE